MKVGDAMRLKDDLLAVSENLLKIERLVMNDTELSEDIANKANINMTTFKVISEARVVVTEKIRALTDKINNTEIES